MKTTKNITLLLSFCFLVFCFTQNVVAQCLGPVNDGLPYIFTLDMDGTETFDVNDFDVSIYYDDTDDKVYINTSDGTQVHTDGMGNVVNLDMNVDVTALSNYVTPPACIFNVGTNQGQFGGGNDGYIALKNGNTYGWLYLQLCGVTGCEDYRVAIAERRFDQGLTDPAITGSCNVIPTLSQWALILLGMSLLIIGIITINQKKIALVTTQSRF